MRPESRHADHALRRLGGEEPYALDTRRVSGDVEDRRGQGGFRMGGPQLGLGGTLLLLLLSIIFGRNFLSFFSGSPAPLLQQ